MVIAFGGHARRTPCAPRERGVVMVVVAARVRVPAAAGEGSIRVQPGALASHLGQKHWEQ